MSSILNEIVVNANTTEQRLAHLQNNKLEHLFIEQSTIPLPVGTICLGVVQDIVAGMNAAFIHIGEERMGFIHRDDLPSFRTLDVSIEQKKQMSISKFLRKGEKIIVQVKKEPVGDKGAKLTGFIEWPGTHLVYLPYSSYVAVSKKIDSKQAEKWRETASKWLDHQEGVLLRTSCAKMTEEALQKEFDQLKTTVKSRIDHISFSKAPEILYRPNRIIKEIESLLQRLSEGVVWVDDFEMKKSLEVLLPNQNTWKFQLYQGSEGIFSHFKVESEIEKLTSRHVWLANGASLTIDETEALSTIDVNTGKFIGKTEQQLTVLKTNRLAAIEAARQIRLRDLAGIIVIDFIDMWNEEQKESVRQLFLQEASKDERTMKVSSFHELGLLILTRKRTGLSLSKRLTINCPVCNGTGRVNSPEALVISLQREMIEHKGKAEVIHIQATKDIIDCFTKQHATLKKHLEVSLRIDLHFHQIEHSHPTYRISRIES